MEGKSDLCGKQASLTSCTWRGRRSLRPCADPPRVNPPYADPPCGKYGHMEVFMSMSTCCFAKINSECHLVWTIKQSIKHILSSHNLKKQTKTIPYNIETILRMSRNCFHIFQLTMMKHNKDKHNQICDASVCMFLV